MSSSPTVPVQDTTTQKVRKRDGTTLQPFDVDKLRRAIRAAWLEVEPVNEKALTKVIRTVTGALLDDVVDVETVQDAVETALMRLGHFGIAKRFILYRQQRTEARQGRVSVPVDPLAISNYIHAAKYARFLPEEGRREVYEETVSRVENMHLRRFPALAADITWAFDRVREKRVLPSMRSFQFSGPAIESNHNRSYNCSATLIDRMEAFSEALYLLLCGCGVGYSVQFEHVEQLPQIAYIDPKKVRHHVIADTIEGWADALKALLQGYQDGEFVEFAYYLIRNAGVPLKTSGGRAPGHTPLKTALERIRKVLDGAQGRKLRSVECHRILCHAADAVLSGGIRRCLPKGTLVHTTRGLIPIESVNVGDEVKTSNSWKPVTEVLDQGDQSTVRIVTRLGDFRCTPNHRMAVLTSPTEYTFRRADELRNGDRLVFVEGGIPGTKTSLPSWTYARSEHDHTSTPITVPELTTDIAWMVGYVHGNGYVRVNRANGDGGNNVVSMTMNELDPETPARVQRLHAAFAAFGVESRDMKIPGEQTRRVAGHSRPLATYFEQFIKAPKTPIVVPDFILQGTKGVRAAYLAGLFDSDGGANNRPVLLVSSVYKDFVRQVQAVYASLGIPSQLTTNREATGNWQAMYHLSLVGEIPRKQFRDVVIPFAVKRIGKNYVSQRDFGYPREWVIDDVSLDYNRKWSKAASQMTVGTYERSGGVRAELLPITVEEVIDDNVVVPTFDLSVADQHEFVAEGLLVHNSAMIALFSLEDSEMMQIKTGNWFASEPWLANANNSVALKRDEIKKKAFKRIFQMTKQWGEPGFVFVSDFAYICNPCAEVNFFPRLTITEEIKTRLGITASVGEVRTGWAFCNLCEINAAKFKSIDDMMIAGRAATIIGTVQASYTDMPYLGWVSEEIAKRDALLGVGMTGMLDAPEIALDPEAQRATVGLIRAVNVEYAEKIGINSAARVSVVKPSGTASLELCGVASGHHAHHARRYIRRVTADELEPVFLAFKEANPHMCVRKPDGKWVIEFPVEAPANAIVKDDLTAISFLEMVKSTQQNWILPGTSRTEDSPGLHNNVSNTVVVKPEEWDDVAEYLWDNREFFTGVSLLPSFADKQFAYAPLEAVTTPADEARWNAILASYKPVDYTDLFEADDATNLKGEAACAGGACSIV